MSENGDRGALVAVVIERSGLTMAGQVLQAGEVIHVAAERVEAGVQQGLWRVGDDGPLASESYLAPKHETARLASPLMTFQEAADMLNVSLSHLRRMLAKGLLEVTDVAGVPRVHRGDLGRWLDADRRDRALSVGQVVVQSHGWREPTPSEAAVADLAPFRGEEPQS